MCPNSTRTRRSGRLPARRADDRADPLPLMIDADGDLDFSRPPPPSPSPRSPRRRASCTSSARRASATTDLTRIDAAARHAAIVRSGNMSLGVNLLAALVRQAAQALGPDFDIEIVEMHHRTKVDAPSGTALLLGRGGGGGARRRLKDHSARGRDGLTGARRAATSASPRSAAARWSATTASSSPARASG